ncbi:MAG TPA: type II toxin-antitoxin system VapC family toxin [Bryobacteraceae bacterium]|jgi:predicted nucleic acid-binding protein|nr:type II toxin-antitoxin system VapC family toxin [Bryobacteraceae bacterium]
MIVIDASALLEVLLTTGVGARVHARLSSGEETLHAPHLLDLEIIHVLRRYCLIGQLQPNRAAEALVDLRDLRLVRHPHEPYVPRIWQLRHSLTAYDAAYVALAEALQAPLITRDSRLASAHGHRAKIELIA